MEFHRTPDNLGTSATQPQPPATCAAIVQEGHRKGAGCRFPPSSDNAYCGRHQRNRIYDEGRAAGKIWCRFFFRGCDATVAASGTACDACKSAKQPAAPPCAHEGCKNRAKEESTYCGKHKRDELLKSGIRYCDVARGCLNIFEPTRSSCSACLEKQRIADNNRYAERKALHTAVTAAVGAGGASTQLCCYCGKDFAPFKTSHGKESHACPSCRENQQKQDTKRGFRGRNFKKEVAKNQAMHFKQHFNNAVKRSLPFEITFDEFNAFVGEPCYFCGHKAEGESNGIDRYDNSKGYIKENCRPCCEECNRIKHVYPAEFIIDRAHVISKISDSRSFLEKWKDYYKRKSAVLFSVYKSGADKRGIAFELEVEQFNTISSAPCYLCGFTGPNGIDRRDSNGGYTLINCSACCAGCNISKADISLEIFYDKNRKISEKHPITGPISDYLSSAAPPMDNRKHWKASTLYTALRTGREQEFIEDQPAGIVSAEDISSLRAAIAGKPRDSAIVQLRRFLATISKRKKRAPAPDTITHVG
jgi:hypothetical protein